LFTQFFGLKNNPFGKEVDIEHLFLSRDLVELDSRLKYLQIARGIGLVCGEPGCGKSTALRKYVSGLNLALFKPSYFALSTVTVLEFYQGLALMLGEQPMEDLRLLLNFKMDSQNPYILILSGQSLIRNKLTLNINNPLRQRITVKYFMHGLNPGEIKDYVVTRLKIAGRHENLFAEPALEAIYAITNGLPRLVNNLVTASLLYACDKKLRLIDEEVIYQAQNELNL